jgi:hypothetical protein
VRRPPTLFRRGQCVFGPDGLRRVRRVREVDGRVEYLLARTTALWGGRWVPEEKVSR